MSKWQLKTPVCFIIFNRPDVTERVFQKIREAKPPKLLVVADGARTNKAGEEEKCLAARAIINQVDWKCEVLTNYSEINLGCRKRIYTGLNWVFDQVEEAIILEDDCLPHPTFFRFCEESLEKYRHNSRIMLVSGQNLQFGQKRRNYSYYFSRYNHCWGWATWKRAWQHYDDTMALWPQFRDENWLLTHLQDEEALRYWSLVFQGVYEGFDTWDSPWLFACWLNQGLSILPNLNLVSNIGFGEEATHTKDADPIFSNMAVEEMQFPLKHPPFIIRDSQADNFTERSLYGGTLPEIEPTISITELLNNAIHLLGRNSQINKINLQNTTLVTISSVEIELTLLSLVISNLNANFNRVLFFTSEEIDQRYLELFPQLEIIQVNPIRSLVEYSRFVIKELNSFIDTEFCLVTQGDGFIVNPQLWSDEFLNYDYVSAPWPKQVPLINPQGQLVEVLDMSKNRVGNGGFSLRSKKLLEVCSQLDFDNIKTSSLLEDLIICHYLYDWFKNQDIKFSPLEVATKFSFEQLIEEVENFSWENTFGFHGKGSVIHVLSKLSQDLDFASEKQQENNLVNDLNLKEINYIIFPDWLQSEESLGLELQAVIKTLATHPDSEKINLLIYTGNIDAEEAAMFLSSIAMNLLMEEDIDISDGLGISPVGNLSPIQWEVVFNHVTGRIILEQEDKDTLVSVVGENIQSINFKSS